MQVTGVTPSLQKCTDCCNSIHCPFCSPKIFQPATKSRVLKHLEAHKRKAVKHKVDITSAKATDVKPYCEKEEVLEQDGNGILTTASNEEEITIEEIKTTIVDINRATATYVKTCCEKEGSTDVRTSCVKQTKNSAKSTEYCTSIASEVVLKDIVLDQLDTLKWFGEDKRKVRSSEYIPGDQHTETVTLANRSGTEDVATYPIFFRQNCQIT
ncbi:unnamed protein product [Boreogadus saida]